MARETREISQERLKRARHVITALSIAISVIVALIILSYISYYYTIIVILRRREEEEAWRRLSGPRGLHFVNA